MLCVRLRGCQRPDSGLASRVCFGPAEPHFRGCYRLAVPEETATYLLPMTDAPVDTKTILLIEDRREVLDVLGRTLSSNGFSVLQAMDGDSGLRTALDQRPDLVILDIGLPKLSGLHVARELRNRAFTAPILMLTALDTVPDKVSGLDSGADDYLAKPFDYDELLARVRALLRRSVREPDATVVKIGDLSVDLVTRDVTRAGRPISLTQKEYGLLEYLVRHAGTPVTREQISEQVWRQPFDANTNIVDVYINYLRKKLDVDDLPPLVHTVRGVGYVLRPSAPVAAGEDAASTT